MFRTCWTLVTPAHLLGQIGPTSDRSQALIDGKLPASLFLQNALKFRHNLLVITVYLWRGGCMPKWMLANLYYFNKGTMAMMH